MTEPSDVLKILNNITVVNKIPFTPNSNTRRRLNIKLKNPFIVISQENGFISRLNKDAQFPKSKNKFAHIKSRLFDPTLYHSIRRQKMQRKFNLSIKKLTDISSQSPNPMHDPISFRGLQIPL